MRAWLTIFTILLLSAFLALSPGSAGAKASTSSARSTNGYSRPTPPPPPPVTAPTPAPTAPAASSKGYALPGQAAAPAAAARAPASGSDAALSRQTSGNAFKNYSAQQERAAYARSAPPTPVAPAFSSYTGRYSSYDSWYLSRSTWYGGMGWGPPVYVYRSQPSFGMWDAMFLWFMLDSISNASHARWFYDHQQDPGYAEWRQEANRLAADDAELKAKLANLDARTASLEGQPRDPSYMPPDTKPELALAAEHAVAAAPSSGSGHPTLYFLLAMMAVGTGLFFWRRSRLA